jgi:hypothetical protein
VKGVSVKIEELRRSGIKPAIFTNISLECDALNWLFA